MKYRRTVQGILLSILFGLPVSVPAQAEYELEASGKNETAALGNLKMKAFRTEMARHLSPDELKSNAKIIRTEIFLKIDDYVSPKGDISYRPEGDKIVAAGLVTVDDGRLLETLGKTPLARADSASGKASAPGSEENSSESPEKPVPPAQADSEKSAVPETDRLKPSSSVETASGYEALKEYRGSTSAEDDKKFRDLLLNGFAKPEDVLKALENGANPNVMSSMDLGYSSKLKKQLSAEVPLLYRYLSRKNPSPEVVKILVEHGAYYNWENPEGTISLAALFLKGSEDILEYWLSLRPDLRRLRNLNVWKALDGEKVRDVLLLDWMSRKDSLKKLDHYQVFTGLLDLGLPANEKIDLHNCYLTFRVYEKGGAKYLKALLDHGADPNLFTAFETSPLYIAAREGDVDLFRSAVSRGVVLNPEGVPSFLLYYLDLVSSAAGGNRSYSLDFIKAITEAGGDINYESPDGKYSVARKLFSSRSSPDIIEYWLSLSPDIKKMKSFEKFQEEALWSWLNFKSVGEKRHLDLTGKLVDLGFDPNARSGKSLMIEKAYEKGGIDYVRLFLEKGADPNARDGYEKPLLFLAAETKNPDFFRLLAEYRADLNILNKYGESILYTAVDEDEPDLEFIRTVIEKGADVNFVRSKNGLSVLMLAVRDRSVSKDDVTDLLLKSGANPNAATPAGRTALMMAVSKPKNPSLKTIESLINAGAALETQDRDGATALTFAIASNHPAAIRLLMEKGADPERALSVTHEVKGRDGKKAVKSLRELINEADKSELKEMKELLAGYL